MSSVSSMAKERNISMSQDSNWMIVEVFADEENVLERLKASCSEARVLQSTRLGGTEEIIQVALPVVVAAIEVVISIMSSRKDASRKRLRIEKDVLDAEGLSEEELRAALSAYVKTNKDKTS